MKKQTLTTKNIGKAIIGTVLCFVPVIDYIFASGQFSGYRPFSTILVTKDVLSAGAPVSSNQHFVLEHNSCPLRAAAVIRA